MSDSTRLTSTIYVSGLAPELTHQHLHSAFIPFGDIADINLPNPDLAPGQAPPPPGTQLGHRGFGYVEFESEEDAKEAIDNMDRSELFGKVIRVAKAKPMKAVGEGLGSKVALWEQEGYLAGLAEDDKTSLQLGGAKEDGGQIALSDPMEDLVELAFAGPTEK
jgi:hypothetical protein